jgi:predicted transcriptional regulator
MKQLRSNIKELREVFEQISVRYISVFNLNTAKEDEDGIEVKNRMLERDYDVMPVVSNNRIVGYVLQSELHEGTCFDSVT